VKAVMFSQRGGPEVVAVQDAPDPRSALAAAGHRPYHCAHKGTCRQGNTPMRKYRCVPCGYIYDPAQGDPDSGIAPETPFEELPDDWVCPVCGAARSEFEPLE